MNILLVTMEMNIGGAETHVLELARGLVKSGHNVTVASAGGKLVKLLEDEGIKHVYAPLKDKKINHIIKSCNIIKNVIKTEKIDVVHAHARIPGFVCGIACKNLKVHFVTTIHGIYRVNFILKLLTNWGEKTLAVSNDVREHAIREYKLNPDNVFVTVNGIDIEKFKNERKNAKSENDNIPKLIHVSRLDEDTSSVATALIDISNDLKDKLNIVIVGSGNKLEYLKEYAKNNSNVTFLGARTDIEKVLNEADLFVGVSRAALEAMACELPVILAGNIANGQGYIGIFDESTFDIAKETNFTCRGVEEITKEKLKNDILKVLNFSIESKQKMGQFNRNVVKNSYSIEKMVEDSIKVYKNKIM